ncbi:MAG: guanylate kinase [Anaerotruncus rubiinfantis]|jgi:guanylate kinase|uniref:guanylate kinase n=1 Tax=Anaerotruncus rubiinfantis TaxID=1720200 RepID=UPI0018982465
MSNRGMLIVYSGPSGVGKGTLLAPYLKSHPDAALSVSVTTRAPRPGETDGVEYSFITRERFEQLIKSDGLLEYAEYSGNYYGTPRAAVEEKIAAGRDVVLEIEVQGAMKIKKSFPDASFIFILPPSYAELKRRLQGRGTEPPQVVARRLAAARRELSYAGEYEYAIVNDSLETAGAQLAAVIEASRCRTKYMKDFIKQISEVEEV